MPTYPLPRIGLEAQHDDTAPSTEDLAPFLELLQANAVNVCKCALCITSYAVFVNFSQDIHASG